MYVCICNKVTDKQIQQAAKKGVCSVDSLCKTLKVASCCGKCRDCAKQVLDEALTGNWRMDATAA